jgi:hypothetical protein
MLHRPSEEARAKAAELAKKAESGILGGALSLGGASSTPSPFTFGSTDTSAPASFSFGDTASESTAPAFTFDASSSRESTDAPAETSPQSAEVSAGGADGESVGSTADSPLVEEKHIEAVHATDDWTCLVCSAENTADVET